MQKLKMLTTAGSREQGKVYDVEDKEAMDLLSHGKAVRFKPKPIPPAPPKREEK